MATELYSETSLDNVEDLFASDYPRLGKTAVVLSGAAAGGAAAGDTALTVSSVRVRIHFDVALPLDDAA